MQILKSATKVVLLIMVVWLLVFTFLGKVDGKDFVGLIGIIFAFYFGQKSLPTNWQQ